MSSMALAVEIIFRLLFDISIESVPVLEDTVNDTTPRVDWDKLSVEDKAAYVNNTDTILSSVRIPIEAICCKDVNCENQSHRDELGIFFTKSWWVPCLRLAINLNTSVVALVPSQAGMTMCMIRTRLLGTAL